MQGAVHTASAGGFSCGHVTVLAAFRLEVFELARRRLASCWGCAKLISRARYVPISFRGAGIVSVLVYNAVLELC